LVSGRLSKRICKALEICGTQKCFCSGWIKTEFSNGRAAVDVHRSMSNRLGTIVIALIISPRVVTTLFYLMTENV
jgi:hypothetical protein